MAALRRFKTRMKIMKDGMGIYRKISELTRPGFESYTTQNPHDSTQTTQAATVQQTRQRLKNTERFKEALRVKSTKPHTAQITALHDSRLNLSRIRVKTNDTTPTLQIFRHDSKNALRLKKAERLKPYSMSRKTTQQT